MTTHSQTAPFDYEAEIKRRFSFDPSIPHDPEVLARALMELLDYCHFVAPHLEPDDDRRYKFARDVNAAYWVKGPRRLGLILSQHIQNANNLPL